MQQVLIGSGAADDDHRPSAPRRPAARARGASLVLGSALGVGAGFGLVNVPGVAQANAGGLSGSSAGSGAGSSAGWLVGAAQSPTARSTNGTPAVGALFVKGSGPLGRWQHFCSGSVVHSAKGNLVLTAAHCDPKAEAGGIVFVPEYHSGKAPFGIWDVSRVYEGASWRRDGDPNDDIALLTVYKPGSRTTIESLTGGESLPTSGPKSGAVVTVTGYPDPADRPVTCTNHVTFFNPTQLQFDCGGFPDGTSGSPLLADVSSKTGRGVVIGAIGGYEQGGYESWISYAAVLGSNVKALYDEAEG